MTGNFTGAISYALRSPARLHSVVNMSKTLHAQETERSISSSDDDDERTWDFEVADVHERE